MIAGTNLSMRFGKKVLFDGVSVKFTPGNRYGLIGANGVGKSTFMKILAGQLEQSEGEVALDKDCTMGFLKQDHYEYDQETVENTVYRGHEKLWKLYSKREELYNKSDAGEITDDEADYLYGDLEAEFGDAGGYTMEADAAKLLNGLGLPDSSFKETMSQLTGGLKLRVLLAQVLFAKPDVLLLDEPTNHLDMETIDWLSTFLTRYEGVVIVISHDRHFLNSVTNQVADLDYGELRLFSGNYDDFMMANEIALEQQRRDNAKKEKRAGELKDFISRFGANASKAKQATARKKELDGLGIEKITPSSRVSPYIRFESPFALGEKVIELEHVCKSYDGVEVLKDVTLSIAKDERIAILGPNGIGKTTLVKIMIDQLKADSGKAEIGSTVKVSYFPQDSADVLDNDMAAIDWLAKFSPEEGMTETDLRSAMGRMLFSGESVHKKIGVLSGGERARLITAAMLLEGGNVIVLDEPTNHLDLEAIESLNYALTLVSTPVVFVSHDREFVNSLATRIIEIHDIDNVTDYPGTMEEYESWKARNKK